MAVTPGPLVVVVVALVVQSGKEVVLTVKVVLVLVTADAPMMAFVDIVDLGKVEVVDTCQLVVIVVGGVAVDEALRDGISLKKGNFITRQNSQVP